MPCSSIFDVLVDFNSKLYIAPMSPLFHELVSAINDGGHEGVQCMLHHLHHDFQSPNICLVDKDFIRNYLTYQW